MVGASSEAWGRSHHTDLGRADTISKISLAGMTITAWRGCGRRLIFANKAGKGMTHGSPRRLLFHSIPFSSPYLFRSPHEPGNLQPQEGSLLDRYLSSLARIFPRNFSADRPLPLPCHQACSPRSF